MRLCPRVHEFRGDQRLSASKIFALHVPAKVVPGLVRDQRLSASKIFAPSGNWTLAVMRRCDQRLSASKIFAQEGDVLQAMAG